MNRSAARSVFSPRVKASPLAVSPRQQRVNSSNRRSISSRSTDQLTTPSRPSPSEEDIHRLEKKIDDLCLLKSSDDRLGSHKADQALKLKNEELQAVMSELAETKSALGHMERKYHLAHKATERLEKENKAQTNQLEEIRQEQMENRRRSMNRRILEERKDQKLENVVEEDEENMGNLLLKQGLRREEKLTEEVRQLKLQLEKERAEYKSSMADMLVAVKVAVGLKEEAEAELNRFHQNAPDYAVDSVWAGLMRRWNGGTKRHSLLQWVNYKLTPYPSLKVSNFTDDWRDGKAFCALVQAHRPDLVTRSQLQGDCVALAGQMAESLQMADVGETLFAPSPDWNRVMAVVFSLYKKFSEEKET